MLICEMLVRFQPGEPSLIGEIGKHRGLKIPPLSAVQVRVLYLPRSKHSGIAQEAVATDFESVGWGIVASSPSFKKNGLRVDIAVTH